jgi:sec-independent protein translocase protein TatA
MLNIGPQELLLILLVALVVVGPRRLPELGRSIGKGLRELRKAQDEVRKTIQVNMDEERATRAGRPATTGPDASSAGDGAVPAAADPGAVSGSNVAAAAAASGAGDVSEVSRSLGRGIAELRRARRDIQRTFRVDLTEPRPQRPAQGPGPASRPPGSAPAPSTPTSSPPASSTPANDAQDAGTRDDATGDPPDSPPE